MEKCIVFVGMPGCGKSSVAKVLAEKISMPFYDTDAVIVDENGISIPDMFKKYGEEYFREKETQALEKTLCNAPCVIACGGGIVLKEKNRELLKDSTVVFLKRELDCLPKDGRPLSQKNDIREMYKKRLPLYELCSDITIDNIGIEETAQKIKDRL